MEYLPMTLKSRLAGSGCAFTHIQRKREGGSEGGERSIHFSNLLLCHNNNNTIISKTYNVYYLLGAIAPVYGYMDGCVCISCDRPMKSVLLSSFYT